MIQDTTEGGGLDYITVKNSNQRVRAILNQRLFDGEDQISDHPILSTTVEP